MRYDTGITICDLQLSVSLRLDLVFNVIVLGLVLFQRWRRFRAIEPKVWVAAVTFGVWGSYGIMCKPIGSQLTRAEQCCATSRLFQDLLPHFSPLSLALLSERLSFITQHPLKNATPSLSLLRLLQPNITTSSAMSWHPREGIVVLGVGKFQDNDYQPNPDGRWAVLIPRSEVATLQVSKLRVQVFYDYSLFLGSA
jgi:hypothetical protein